MVTHSGASLHRWWYFPLHFFHLLLSPLPYDHNIWFHCAPYTCLCLIKLAWTLNTFPLFAFYFLPIYCIQQRMGGKIRTGNSRRGQVMTSRSNGTEDQEVIRAGVGRAVNQPRAPVWAGRTSASSEIGLKEHTLSWDHGLSLQSTPSVWTKQLMVWIEQNTLIWLELVQHTSNSI